jgi:hypothetical protein
MSVETTIRSKVQKFILGKGNHKYTAVLKNGKRINFGHRDYQHYKDSVPIDMGGGRWAKKDHLDATRRRNYRTRHAGVLTTNGTPAYKVKLSPSWFSYYLLW